MELGNSTNSDYCVYAYDTYQWLPGALTTFALPVVEIEALIEDLTWVYNDLVYNQNNSFVKHGDNPDPKDITNINRQINNWKTVLDTYRSHNTALTSMFQSEALQFAHIVQSFKKWQSGPSKQYNRKPNGEYGPKYNIIGGGITFDQFISSRSNTARYLWRGYVFKLI